MLEEYRITQCVPQSNYKIALTFEDGAHGVVTLDHLVGKGVFVSWSDYNEFQNCDRSHIKNRMLGR